LSLITHSQSLIQFVNFVPCKPLISSSTSLTLPSIQTPSNKTTSSEIPDEGDGDDQNKAVGRGKLDAKTRAQILKDRQKSKKAKRQSAAAQGAADEVGGDEDDTV